MLSLEPGGEAEVSTRPQAIMMLADDLQDALQCSIERARLRDSSLAVDGIVRQLDRSLRAHTELVMTRSAQRWKRRPPNLDDLPALVVCRLLEHVPLTDRLAVSQTSSSLRTASICCSPIWSRIRVVPQIRGWRIVDSLSRATTEDAPRVWHGVLELLARSEPLLTQVSLLLDVSRSYSELKKLLTAVFQRSDDLTLDLRVGRWATYDDYSSYPWPKTRSIHSLGSLDYKHMMRASVLLSTPAPHLHTLTLNAYDDPGFGSHTEKLVLRPDLLCGEASRLRSCKLRGINMPKAPCTAFSRLTLFDYQPCPACLHALELESILLQMPQLHTLGLTLFDFVDHRPVASSPPRPLAACLRRVAIVFLQPVSTDAVRCAASYFHGMRISQLHLDLYRLWIGRPGFALLDVFSLLGNPDDVKVYDAIATATIGECAISWTLWPNFNIGDDPAQYSNLTSLTLCESHWPETGSLPPVPRMQSLHIVILPYCRAQEFMQQTSIFVTEWPAPWDCPALQDLHLSYLRGEQSDCFFEGCTCYSGNGSIALADVYTFITTALRFSADRLSKVALAGFSAIVDPEPGLALLALQQVAHQVEVQEQVPGAVLAMRASAARRGPRNSWACAATDIFNPSDATAFGSDEWDELVTDH